MATRTLINDADILEYSNIAWPNSAMWAPAPRVFKYNSGSAYSDLKEMDEAHGHSPTRYESRASASQTGSLPLYNTWMPRDFPVPLTQWQSNPRDPRWPRQEPYMSDPFIEPYVSDRSSRRGARSSAEDVPMPDYVGSSSSSRVISSMTGVSYEHSKQSSAGAAPIDEEQYNQVAEALIPPAAYVSGTHAPANTPTVAVPAGPRMSAAAEARTRSYSKSGSQGSVLKEISDPNSRNVSRNVSESSAKPDPAAESTMEPATKRLQVSPSPQVKGKKEGSGQENKENEGAVETPTRDLRTPSKTLRTSGSAESQRTRSGSHLSKEEEVASTPSKDVSPAAADDPVLRGSLENIFDSGIQLGGGVSEVPGID